MFTLIYSMFLDLVFGWTVKCRQQLRSRADGWQMSWLEATFYI